LTPSLGGDLSARRYFATKEAAEYLGTTPAALRKRVERGEIPYIRDGRRLRFDRLDLDAHMRARRIDAAPQ
jgi:excisionase family DNA binding protein